MPHGINGCRLIMAKGKVHMNIQELFILSNRELLRVISQIKDEQFSLMMPPGMSRKPGNLKTAVQYHTYDDAWVPDVLLGKTKADVGDTFEGLRTSSDVQADYATYNQLAIDAVQDFSALDRMTHLSYGDFPAKDYLQHITTFRAFRSYDIAQLIGIDVRMKPDFVQALLDEYSPLIEGYRAMGVFPPALTVSQDASPQEKLLAMVGRK